MLRPKINHVCSLLISPKRIGVSMLFNNLSDNFVDKVAETYRAKVFHSCNVFTFRQQNWRGGGYDFGELISLEKRSDSFDEILFYDAPTGFVKDTGEAIKAWRTAIIQFCVICRNFLIKKSHPHSEHYTRRRCHLSTLLD
ncbi:hypothetical protein QQ045_030098 [Rhodiola kirilowii]